MERINKILTQLYTKNIGKRELAEIFDVSEKTIENTIKKYNKELKKEKLEIKYDTKIQCYRFDTLLPSKIPHNVFLQLMQEFVHDIMIADDFKEFLELINSDDNLNIGLLNTNSLSLRLQQIIMIKMAFVLNVSLKVQYTGNKQITEEKYIQPHTLISTSFTHYLHVTYSEKNISNVGETRSFALKGIKKIEIDEYITLPLEQNATGNAWGIYSKDKYVLLYLKNPASNFYKREEIARDGAFEFISEEEQGAIIMKMYYNNEQEIVSLLQRWMPHISLYKKSELTDRIYEKIKNNFVQLTINKDIF